MVKPPKKKSRPHTRYRCRTCGNSALFVEERRSISHRLVGWVGRECGYTPISEFETQEVEKVSRYQRRPSYCWVCGGTDIGYALVVEEELRDDYRYPTHPVEKDAREDRRGPGQLGEVQPDGRDAHRGGDDAQE